MVQKTGGLRGFLDFEVLITLDVIRVAYMLGVGALLVAGGTELYIGFTRPEERLIPAIAGAALILAGNLIWRLVCELWIVLFHLHRKVTNDLAQCRTHCEVCAQQMQELNATIQDRARRRPLT